MRYSLQWLPESSHSMRGAPPRKSGASHTNVIEEVALDNTRKCSGTSGTWLGVWFMVYGLWLMVYL
jgi:hypothetical protein